MKIDMVKSKHSNSYFDFLIKRNMVKSKHSQEEMVGFVLIIILVAIIALVFLAINLRKAPQIQDSKEVNSLIQSILKYSTDCYSSSEIRSSIRELVTSCANNENCVDEKPACDVLNSTLWNILTSSLTPGPEKLNKAYILKVFDETNHTILSLKEGICTGSKVGSYELVSSTSGVIEINLDICR